MDRRFERKFGGLRRRLTSRPSQTILQLTFIALLVTTVIYLSAKFFYPSISNYIVPTTRKTTTKASTTTTTLKTTTKPSFDVGCFSDKTSVTLADGSTRPLDMLNVGDEVLVYLPSGHTHKSRVLTIFHHQRSSVRLLDIYTIDQQEPLRLTSSHSILTRKNHADRSSFDYDFASNIAIGDFVRSSKLEPLQVTNIKEVILYNQTISTPLTHEGNIVVNNLIASCYATYRHQWMHVLTTPVRFWYRLGTFPRFDSFIVHAIELYAKITF